MYRNIINLLSHVKKNKAEQYTVTTTTKQSYHLLPKSMVVTLGSIKSNSKHQRIPAQTTSVIYTIKQLNVKEKANMKEEAKKKNRVDPKRGKVNTERNE